MLTQAKINELEATVMQLSAGLELTYGAAGQSFWELNAEMRDSFLWMLAEKAHLCRELLSPTV